MSKLPCDMTVERTVLSAILRQSEAADEAINSLTPFDFFLPEHSRIFEHCCDVHAEKFPVSAFSVAKKISDPRPKYDLNYLLDIHGEYWQGMDFEYYFNKLKNLSSLRRLMLTLQDTLIRAGEEGADYERIVGEFYSTMIKVESGNKGIAHPKEILENFQEGKSYIEICEERHERFRKGLPTFSGISTGYPTLDQMIGGFQNGGLYYIGARTSMGKTTFLLNLVSNIVRETKTAVFSLEMDANMIMEKILCIHADLKYSNFSTGNYTLEHLERIKSLEPFYKNSHLWFDDEQGLTITKLVSRAHRLVRVQGVKIIFIDYLTLVKSIGRHPNKHMMVDEVSKGLQSLAKQLKIPLVVLAQLNRAAADEGRPSLTSFRESGSIEEDADACLLLHRPEYYDPTNKPGMIELIVAKNRIMGKLGTVNFSCNSQSSERYFEAPSIEELRKEKIDEAFSRFTP